MKKEYRSFSGKSYLALCFVLKNLGEVEILEEFLSFEQHIVGIPNYDPRATINATFGYDENDFCDDIEMLVNTINMNDRGENTFFFALDVFVDKHVKTYQRLIDTDLLRSVSILVELMCAVAKLNNETWDFNDKVGIFRTFVNREISRHEDVFYIVRYRIEGNTPQPYLEKFLK